MNELTGAVALAQLRRLDGILSKLRSNKRLIKDQLSEIPNMRFRLLHDEEGDCGTALPLVFDSGDTARAVADAIGSKTLVNTGKHYYGNMFLVLNKRMPAERSCPFACEAHPTDIEYRQGMLPRTDDILNRTVCFALGVTQPGLGLDFGINILTEEQDAVQKAQEFRSRIADIM